MNMTHRRRGVVLILALVVIGLLAGVLAVIGVGTGQQLHQRQTDRVRLAAIAIADSAAAYARRPDRPWPTTQPDARSPWTSATRAGARSFTAVS